MSIEGAFLIWFIIAFIVGAIFAVLLWDTRTMIDGLKKDIDLLETQNIRLKDRTLELETRIDALELTECKKSRDLPNHCYGCKAFEYDYFGWGHCKLYNKRISNYVSCPECMKGGDAECDS